MMTNILWGLFMDKSFNSEGPGYNMQELLVSVHALVI